MTIKTNKLNVAFYIIFLASLSVLSCNQNKTTEDDATKQVEQTERVDLGEFAVSVSGEEKNIDMLQFTKTALDIPYAGNDNVRQTLDITYPSVSEAPYKTIVLFHGGGWQEINNQKQLPLYFKLLLKVMRLFQ